MKPFWDPSETPAGNLSRLGFVAHPNQAESSTVSTSQQRTGIATSATRTANKTDGTATQSTIIELYDVPDSDEVPSRRRSKFPLTAEEENYIAVGLRKWGDDYTRMFRDLKANPMQHTEEKLRKLGSRYLLLAPDQRHVEVPESIQHLLPQEI